MKVEGYRVLLVQIGDFGTAPDAKAQSGSPNSPSPSTDQKDTKKQGGPPSGTPPPQTESHPKP